MHWVDIEADTTVAPSFLSLYLNTTKQDLLSVSVESTESNEKPDLFPAVQDENNNESKGLFHGTK